MEGRAMGSDNPTYSDLMTIINKLGEVEGFLVFTKYFVLHLCKDILKLSDEQFNYLTDRAVEAGKQANGGVSDNGGIWN